MTFTHEQKAAIGGGLQAHSVGALYPLLVVGIDHHKHGLSWVVQNVQTGAYAAVEHVVLEWANAEAAASFVGRAHSRGLDKGTWASGPLSRDAEGNIVIGAQQETPRQAFYNSYDTDTDSV